MPTKFLFARNSGATRFWLVLLVASASLIYVDTATRYLEPVRHALGSFVSLGHHVVESPYRFAAGAAEALAMRATLVDRIADLEARNLELSGIAGRTEALLAENNRMRQLLGSRAQVSGEVLIAELAAVVPNPNTRQVIIDKGLREGVRVGHAVVDAGGLFGQVIETHSTTARVLLIADISHAVPVEVSRNGLRAIAAGTGRMDRLGLENVSVTADIRSGDVLVSSGLGGRFPRGYRVGRVSSVVLQPDLGLLEVGIEPSALLSRSRHLLVVIGAIAGEPQ